MGIRSCHWGILCNTIQNFFPIIISCFSPTIKFFCTNICDSEWSDIVEGRRPKDGVC